MGKLNISRFDVQPEFDMWFYAELSGEKRMDNALLEKLEERWNAWLPLLRGHAMADPSGKGGSYVLIHLEPEVDAEVDATWDESPTDGLALHNLAVTMCMTAAQAAVPELAENGCAPMPRPGVAVQDAFEEIGVNWSPDGSIDRKFAVFTHAPYKGGCEICHLEDTCPNSKTRRN